MFLHYLKISFRNLWKHRLQSVISLVGLSVGMACFALSALWLQYIESYDDFVKDNDRLYLLSPGQDGFRPDSKEYNSRKAIADKLKESFPEIESVLSFAETGVSYLTENDTQINYNGLFFDEFSILFDLVDLKLKDGRLPKENDSEICISTTAAIQLFGSDDVVGKSLYQDRFDGKIARNIVGVFEPLPINSSFFSYISVLAFSRSDPYARQMERFNLIKVYPDVDITDLSDKIRHAKISYSTSYYQGGTEDVCPDLSTYSLLPLRQLRSDYPSAYQGINGDNLRIVVVISLITIISVLCHYFITMITLIRIRCRALALRRMLGSSVMGIIGMNMIETLILFLASSVLGAAFIYFLMPMFIYTLSYSV